MPTVLDARDWPKSAIDFPQTPERTFIRRKARMTLCVIVLVVGASDALVNEVLSRLNALGIRLESAPEAMLDAALLMLVCAPMLWFFAFRKLVAEIAAEQDRRREIGRRNAELLDAIKTHDVVCITDPCGRITDVNDHYCKVSGYSRAELIGSEHPRLSALLREATDIDPPARKLTEEGYWRGESRDWDRHGRPYWLVTTIVPQRDVRGKVQQYIALSQDISLLKAAHERLRQSEERLEGILASLDDVVWSATPEPLRITYLNRAAEKVYGRPIQDFFDNPGLWLDIVHGRDKQRVTKALSRELPNDRLEIDYRIVRPDGEVRWIHDCLLVVRDPNGHPLRVDGSAVDITVHKSAEDALKRKNRELQYTYDQLRSMQSQLLQSEKLASVGQLAAGVAHEINNPIGYVHSNLGTLQRYVQDLLGLIQAYEAMESRLPENDAEAAGIRRVKQSIDLEFLKSDAVALMRESLEGVGRVTKIVQDLKDFSRQGNDEDWQFADLHKGLESTLNIAHNELKYKTRVVKDFGDLPEIQCLPCQLNQVFMNLLVNAAHAIEDRGVITIRTGRQDDQAWIEIADTGKGIAPEHVKRIFDPFFTTKPVGQGTGLGLSLSYNIVRKHNGEIRVDSTPGQGTRFRVVLPLRRSEPTHA